MQRAAGLIACKKQHLEGAIRGVWQWSCGEQRRDSLLMRLVTAPSASVLTYMHARAHKYTHTHTLIKCIVYNTNTVCFLEHSARVSNVKGSSLWGCYMHAHTCTKHTKKMLSTEHTQSAQFKKF